MIDKKFETTAETLFQQLPKGAFLTVQDGEKANLMTIGWGSIGVIWSRPVLSVLVRYSRYTYELIEKYQEFTVSVPRKNEMKNELAICGTKSGRDTDKFQLCGLIPMAGRVLRTPVVSDCDIYYECRVVCRQAIQPALMDGKIISNFYANNDYHVLYHGEIAACYGRE